MLFKSPNERGKKGANEVQLNKLRTVYVPFSLVHPGNTFQRLFALNAFSLKKKRITLEGKLFYYSNVEDNWIILIGRRMFSNYWSQCTPHLNVYQQKCLKIETRMSTNYYLSITTNDWLGTYISQLLKIDPFGKTYLFGYSINYATFCITWFG